MKAPRLKWLHVGGRATGNDLQWIARLSRLRGLSLCGADLTAGDLSSLASLSELQWLDLSNARLPALKSSPLPSFAKLEFLGLASVRLTGDDAPAIPVCPMLRTLLLSDTEVLDQAIQALPSTSPHLKHLELSGAAGVTERSLSSLRALMELEYLHLGKTGLEATLLARDGEALRKLETQLPRCSILLGD